MIKEFYKKFYKKLKITIKICKSNVGKSRLLGKDPITNKLVITRFGKYGPLIQIGENKKKESIKFISLKNRLIEYITLKESLNLFKFPRKLGNFEKNSIFINIGKYGPYIKHNNKFYTIPKKIKPILMNKIDSIKIIKYKRKFNFQKTIKYFSEKKDIKLLNGKLGPYIKLKNKNITIPKSKNPLKLTLKECIQIISIYTKKSN